MAPGDPVDRVLMGAAVLSILLLLTMASFRRIWETDFFWQYKTGEIVAREGPPDVDTLSYVSHGRPWIEMRWLYCRLLQAIVSLAGWPGAVVAKWLVMLAAFALATAAAPWRRGAVAACVVLPLAILASSQRFFVRPELLSFLFFSLFVYLVVRSRSGTGRGLYFLPFLEALWANLHTLFLLGPALLGLFLLVEAVRLRGEPRRLGRIAAVLAATCAACLATPYGLSGVRFGLHLVSEMNDPLFHRISAELAPTFSFGQRYTAVLCYEVLLGACAVTALSRLRSLDSFLALLLASQLYLSLSSIRNLPLFCLAAIPFAIAHAPESLRFGPVLRRAALVLATGLCLHASRSLLTDRFNVRQNDSNQFGAGLATHRFPVRATRFLKDRLQPKTPFHPMFEGSYLLAQDVPVFIDPRLEVHAPAHLDRYLRMMEDETAWREALAQFQFDAALVDLGSPFLRYLRDEREWRLVYFDEVAAVFAREGKGIGVTVLGPEEIAATAARLRQEMGPPRVEADLGPFSRLDSPLPYLRVAAFLLKLGQGQQAEPFARDAIAAYRGVPGAHEILGEILEARSDLPGALGEYEAELSISPHSVVAGRQAGLIHFREGRHAHALALLRRTVDQLPGDAEAWAVLTKIHADAGRTGEALQCAARAAALEPNRAAYVSNLGRLYGEVGRLDDAIAALQRGLALDPGNVGVCRDLAVFLARRGRREEALSMVDRGLRHAPDDAELLRLRQAIARSL